MKTDISILNKRREFHDMLDFVVDKINQKNYFSVIYDINDNVVYLIDYDNVIIMFMFELDTFYCYNFDSDYIDGYIDDDNYINFLLDLLNLLT